MFKGVHGALVTMPHKVTTTVIPAYLEFFCYGTAMPDELRAVSRIKYA
jgi:hypothetical protein